ncbi:hypothetical protein HZC31_05680 [Candidatus Woesearchaeota archaeon]|nr:hypothetical protein [Candidatus Woesearchaeota archaeon]
MAKKQVSSVSPDKFFMTLVIIVAILGIFVMIVYDTDILSLRKEDTLIGQALSVKKGTTGTSGSLTLEELTSTVSSNSLKTASQINKLEERIVDLESKVTSLEGTIDDLTEGSSSSGSSSSGNSAKPGEGAYS